MCAHAQLRTHRFGKHTHVSAGRADNAHVEVTGSVVIAPQPYSQLAILDFKLCDGNFHRLAHNGLHPAVPVRKACGPAPSWPNTLAVSDRVSPRKVESSRSNSDSSSAHGVTPAALPNDGSPSKSACPSDHRYRLRNPAESPLHILFPRRSEIAPAASLARRAQPKPRRKRVERSRVAHAAFTKNAAHARHHVVRSQPRRLIDNQHAIHECHCSFLSHDWRFLFASARRCMKNCGPMRMRRPKRTEAAADESSKGTPEQIRARTFQRAAKLLAAKPRSVAELRERLLEGRRTTKVALRK